MLTVMVQMCDWGKVYSVPEREREKHVSHDNSVIHGPHAGNISDTHERNSVSSYMYMYIWHVGEHIESVRVSKVGHEKAGGFLEKNFRGANQYFEK